MTEEQTFSQLISTMEAAEEKKKRGLYKKMAGDRGGNTNKGRHQEEREIFSRLTLLGLRKLLGKTTKYTTPCKETTGDRRGGNGGHLRRSFILFH